MQTSNKKFTFIHRFLHWSIALVILFILLTVFLRLGWMNKNNMGDIIYNDLQKKGITITADEAIMIAKDIRKPMFIWHIYMGYILIGLYIMKLVYMAFSKKKSRFSLKKYTVKQKFQKIVYILFYIGLGIIVVSGFLIQNVSKDYKSFFEEIHKLSFFIIIIFLVLHFGGIFLGEKTTDKGIVSAMIGGDK